MEREPRIVIIGGDKSDSSELSKIIDDMIVVDPEIRGMLLEHQRNQRVLFLGVENEMKDALLRYLKNKDNLTMIDSSIGGKGLTVMMPHGVHIPQMFMGRLENTILSTIREAHVRLATMDMSARATAETDQMELVKYEQRAFRSRKMILDRHEKQQQKRDKHNRQKKVSQFRQNYR
jgi:hypothetical protein